MKKTLALILALVLTLALAACGGNNSDAPGNSNPSTDSPSTSGDSSEVQDVTLKIWTASEELELMKKWAKPSPPLTRSTTSPFTFPKWVLMKPTAT